MAQQLDRSMRDTVRQTGKRPREAYCDMIASLPKRFRESSTQQELIQQLPTFSQVQAQLSRHRQHTCIPVPDPRNIPDELKTTLRGREVCDGDPHKDERFLLYSGQDGRLLVFCAPTELAVLYQSEYVVCDGTFEMSPDSAYQLYTMHGFLHGESMPLVWALLPSKSSVTYVEMFTAVRDALVNSFGSTGCSRTFLVDFEAAAIKAIQSVFTNSIVKGCCFHYRQALYRKVQAVGLKGDYENNDNSTVGLRDWIQQLMSMSMIPAWAIPFVWSRLQFPPTTVDAATYAKLLELAGYFDNTWVNGDFPPTLWSHYDNVGPRTTNHAEGFHNSLNVKFGMPHPSLRSFLNWLQKAQYEVQCRIIQLEAGRQPKARQATYVQNDANIWSAKLRYSMRIGRIFSCLFPHPQAWEEFHTASMDYMRHCSYMLGC